MMGPKLKKSGQNNVNNKNVEHPQQQPKPNPMPRVPINLQNAILHPPSSSRFHTNEKPKFVGSLSILHAVVDAINTRIFCKNLDDIELEWCDKLTERKAVTYKLEATYKKAHAAIRTDPSHPKTKKPAPATAKRWNKAKLTWDQRKQYVTERKAAFLAKLKAEADA